ncbi:MAG: hypothetical protein NTW73_03045 [Candidatus Parcubacteria bacterium]|nr:hypothetical protein [Candidatus Parcubacteria bacterium]
MKGIESYSKKENGKSNIEIEKELKIQQGLKNLNKYLSSLAKKSNEKRPNLVEEKGDDCGRVNIAKVEHKLKVLEKQLEFGKKEKNKSIDYPLECEKIVTYLLAKYLGDDYIVVRASLYDDYFNGIDTMVIEKETGRVICTLNEVCGNEEQSGPQGKKNKVIEMNLRGYYSNPDTGEKTEQKGEEHFGTRCVYGVKSKNFKTPGETEEIEHCEIDDILLLSVPLNMSEIDEVLIGLTDDKSELGGRESEIYDQCINKLIYQAEELQDRVITEIMTKAEEKTKKPETISWKVQMLERIKSGNTEEIKGKRLEWIEKWEKTAGKKWVAMFLQVGELIKALNQMKFKKEN